MTISGPRRQMRRPGEAKRPWFPGRANPVVYTDPTGSMREGPDADEAQGIVEDLHRLFGVEIAVDWGYELQVVGMSPGRVPIRACRWFPGNWESPQELTWTLRGVQDVARAMGLTSDFRSAMRWRPVVVERKPWNRLGGGVAPVWWTGDG